MRDDWGAPAYCALCDAPCAIGPLCPGCEAIDDEEEEVIEAHDEQP